MRFKTTKKAVMQNFSSIYCVGYCEMQYLLTAYYSESYTTRPEGWGSDIYDLGNGMAISTGYSPFGSHRIDYTELTKAEAKARSIYSYSNKWSQKRKHAEVKRILMNLLKGDK